MAPAFDYELIGRIVALEQIAEKDSQKYDSLTEDVAKIDSFEGLMTDGLEKVRLEAAHDDLAITDVLKSTLRQFQADMSEKWRTFSDANGAAAPVVTDFPVAADSYEYGLLGLEIWLLVGLLFLLTFVTYKLVS